MMYWRLCNEQQDDRSHPTFFFVLFTAAPCRTLSSSDVSVRYIWAFNVTCICTRLTLAFFFFSFTPANRGKILASALQQGTCFMHTHYAHVSCT